MWGQWIAELRRLAKRVTCVAARPPRWYLGGPPAGPRPSTVRQGRAQCRGSGRTAWRTTTRVACAAAGGALDRSHRGKFGNAPWKTDVESQDMLHSQQSGLRTSLTVAVIGFPTVRRLWRVAWWKAGIGLGRVVRCRATVPCGAGRRAWRTQDVVAAQFDVSRQTLYAWLARYAQDSLTGLIDRIHRPDTCPHQAGAEVEASVHSTQRW